MAKTETTVRGYVYTVTSPNGGTVTDASGKLNKTVEPGDQVTVQAPSDSLSCDDDEAVIYKTNFKGALAALGLLGGGDKLPAGYTRLEFLESTGQQYVNTLYIPTAQTGLRVECSTAADLDYLPFATRNDSGESRFACTRRRAGALRRNSAGYGWGVWVQLSFTGETPITRTHYLGRLNWLNSGRATFSDKINGDKIEVALQGLGLTPIFPLYLFACNVGGEANFFTDGKIYQAAISEGGSVKASYVPALDSAGVPCMFDIVSKQPFRNEGSGQFIAGIKDSAQLRTVLHMLPDLTGQDMGTLTLSIPAEANTLEMQEILDTTETQKNWELKTQERAAAASTYSLRRVRKVVWVRRAQSEHGSYVDSLGSRWQVEWCSAIYSPLGNDPTLHGYEPFDSVAQAVAAWGLVPYEYPESMGDNGTLVQGETEKTSPETKA